MNPVTKHRKKIGLTQGDIALLLGVSQSTVAHYEQGLTIPSPRRLQRLSRLFSTAPDRLEYELTQWKADKINTLKKKESDHE